MKICLLGNCQAQHMEMILKTSTRLLEVIRLPPVFTLKEEDKEKVLAVMEEADFIFAQRITDEFKINWVSSSWIREEFGDKVTVWPNVYFDGIFPGVRYIYLPKIGKLMGPLGDYHFDQIYKAHITGQTIEQALEDFAGDKLLETYKSPLEASICQLKRREADVDVVISDFIAARMKKERDFYTPNHPTNLLLAEMLNRILRKVWRELDLTSGIESPYKLDQYYIAASPAIVQNYGLPFDKASIYNGTQWDQQNMIISSGSQRQSYTARELVEEFYRLYDEVNVVTSS